MESIPVNSPFADDIAAFRLTLRAAGKSPKTRRTYCDAATWLAATATSMGITAWADVTRACVREHIASLDQYSPAYRSNQFRALQQFFRFLTAEYDTPSPMQGIEPPRVPQKLVPVVGDSLDKILSACTGSGFEQRRDTAIIRLLAATGARRAEIAGLRVHDLDLDLLSAIVTGKGSRQRIVRFDALAAVAVQRYVKARARHRAAGSDMLWLGKAGPMTGDGIYQMVRRRARQAGVRVYPHQFRHDFSHRWLARGGTEGDLMQQNGWSSQSMVRRYGASAAAERAHAAYDKVMGGA